jgi:hypothetical protein
MITLEHVVSFAIRDRLMMDQLGEALQNDLVVVNPFYRRIVEFADEFTLEHRKLPASGDWEVWLESLPAGMTRDGTREALGRLLALDLSMFTPAYFATEALEQLRRAAAQVARARLNELPDLPPETFMRLAEQVEQVRGAGIQGLARLSDLDTWARPVPEEEITPTGFPTLDKVIGGWRKELWIMFADSGMGKSMLLQNCLANVARAGKRGLHVTLELGVRPQIHRYYRQLAQASRAEFMTQNVQVRKRLRHWMRFAKGEIVLLEFPAYGLEPDGLKRTLERLARAVGDIDVLALDYLDLLTLPRAVSARRGYEDLGRITHEIRALCGAFDLTILTASQAVRRPERKDRLSVRDMGDSYNKVRGADGLLSLVQTKEEEEMHQGRLGILKVRDSGGRGQEIPLYINRELALIQELDHPNTVELMTRLGHLPQAGTP